MKYLALLLLTFLFAIEPAHAGPLAALVPVVIGVVVKSAVLKIVLTLVASVAMSLLQKAMQSKPRPPGLRSERKLTGGVVSRSFILGKYATMGSEVTPPMSGGSSGKTPNAYLTFVIALSDLEIEDLDGIIINGEYATINTGTVASYGNPITGKHNGNAWIEYHLGDQGTASTILTSHYGSYVRPWTSDHIGDGVSYAAVTFKFNPDLYRSEPEIKFVVKGAKLYDPRLDTSVGGSGAHRWNNPATWEYTVNNVVMIYNILRGITFADGTKWGGECSAEDLPLANWVAAMNVCDEAVSLDAGGTEPRYRAGYEVLIAEDEPADIIEELLKGCNGSISEIGGTYKVRVGPPPLPSIFVTDDDFLVSKEQDFVPFPAINASRNTVYASYPNPEENWNTHDAPSLQNATYVAEDDDQEVSGNVQLPTTPYPNQVQRLMRAWLEDDRRWRRHTASFGHYNFALEPLDTIAWTSTRNGYADKLFEISATRENLLTLDSELGLREVDPDDYDWSTTYEVPDPVVAGEWVAPDPLPTPDAGLWDLVALPATELTPSMAIVGTCDFPGADAVLMEYREDGAGTWITLGKVDASQTVNNVINGLIANTNYEARVAYQTGYEKGPWLEIGPVLVTSVPLNDVLEANDQNSGTPAATGSITSITKYMDYPDGNVSYRASFTYTYDATPLDADNVDGFVVGYYAADTNDGHTMLGPDASDQEIWYVRYKNLTPGLATYTEIFFNNRNPVKFYRLGVAPFRKVDKSVDPKGYIIGPIVQSAFFQPAATQAITGTNITFGGQTATAVGAGAAKANTALTTAGNVAGTAKVGGDTGQAASDVATATQRGLVVMDASNNITSGTKIGGSGGLTAADVSTYSARAGNAITSGNKIATNAVETISLTAETVTHLFIGATSSTEIDLDGANYGTFVSVGSSSFTVQEGGADVAFLFTCSVRFGITATDSNLQFTATARITFNGVNSNTFEITQTVLSAGRHATVPITVFHLFEGVSAGSKTFYLEIKVDDPSGTGDYAETRGVRTVQITELKR